MSNSGNSRQESDTVSSRSPSPASISSSRELTLDPQEDSRTALRQNAEDSETSSLPKPKLSPNWAIRLRRQFWWPEEASANLISLAFFVVIVAVLANYDYRPQPDWPYHITLNTFTSVMATLELFFLAVPLQSCLGQLKWMRFDRPNNLLDLQAIDDASKSQWAAFTLVLGRKGGKLSMFAATIGILSLAVGPFQQQLIHSVVTTIPTSNSSIPILTQYYGDSALQIGEDVAVEVGLKRGLYQGMYTNGHQWYNITTNTTDNSTWTTPYRSLAVCSSCIDLTDQIKTNTSSAEIDGTAINTSEQLRATALENTFLSPALNATLVNIRMIGRDPFYNDSVQPANSVRAAQCQLLACTQLFTAKQSNGNLEETLIEPPRMDFDVIGTQNTPQGSFLFAPSANDALGEYLMPRFNMFVQHVPAFGAEDTSLPSGGNPDYGDIVLDALVQSNGHISSFNISDLMDNIARSLTQALRQSSSATEAVGYTSRDVVLTFIDWPWIILAACVHVSVSVLLLLVIMRTRSGVWRPWKGSALAIAFHGIDAEIRHEHPNLDFNDELEQVAKDLKVKLAHTDNGLVLVNHEDIKKGQ